MQNGMVKEEEGIVAKDTPDGTVILIDGIRATEADYVELIKANPQMAQALTVVVQKRLMAEKDLEIAELKKAQTK